VEFLLGLLVVLLGLAAWYLFLFLVVPPVANLVIPFTAEGRRMREAEAAKRWQAEQQAAKERLRVVETLGQLQHLSGAEFECFVSDLFSARGYMVKRQGGTGDEGIDLVLTQGPDRDVVQCKRWLRQIGSPVVREFYGATMHAKARHGFIVTTASFTPDATFFAGGKPMTLVDGHALIAMVRDAGVHLNASVVRVPLPPTAVNNNPLTGVGTTSAPTWPRRHHKLPGRQN
jgi:restriction endonuclease Mrr